MLLLWFLGLGFYTIFWFDRAWREHGPVRDRRWLWLVAPTYALAPFAILAPVLLYLMLMVSIGCAFSLDSCDAALFPGTTEGQSFVIVLGLWITALGLRVAFQIVATRQAAVGLEDADAIAVAKTMSITAPVLIALLGPLGAFATPYSMWVMQTEWNRQELGGR